MTDFLQLARSRHSVRGYTNREVEQEKIDRIIECARLAPSAVNRQPWHLYVVKNDETLGRLHRCYDRPWFAEAPLCIVVCVDSDAAWVRPGDGKSHADIDGAIIAEHICLAAADLGLGSCWVCNFDTARCSEILGLTPSMYPLALIPVGYPADTTTPDKHRKDTDEIVTVI